VVESEGSGRVIAGSEAPARPAGEARSFVPFARMASSRPVPLSASLGSSGLGGVRSFSYGPVLGLSANSILLSPFPPVAGAPVTASVQLVNLERTPVTGARVQLSVDGQPLGEVTADVPATGRAVASGFTSWMAKPGRHDFRASVVLGTRRGEATRPLFLNAAGTRGFGNPLTQGGMPGKSTPLGPRTLEPGSRGVVTSGTLTSGTVTSGSLGGAPDLQLTSTDIRFEPRVPAPGAPMTISITVHNLGASPVPDGRVTAVLTADGREHSRRPFLANVPARGAVTLQWPMTAPTGLLALTVTAAAPGDANPGNNQARAAASVKLPIRTLTRPDVAPTTRATN